MFGPYSHCAGSVKLIKKMVDSIIFMLMERET